MEAVSNGIAIATVCGLALGSGQTFLLQGVVGRHGASLPTGLPGHAEILPALSAMLTLIGATWLARQWTTLREPWFAIVALSLVGLAWFAPGMGAVLAILAFCLTSGRWGVASLAALSALWIVGSLYYLLEWPLGTKAALLACSSLLMAAAAWLQAPSGGNAVQSGTGAAVPQHKRSTLPMIAVAGALVLTTVNVAIWQKEALIEHGKPIFVTLAPADPRSLMQGDFMQLNFALPNVGNTPAEFRYAKPFVVATRDKRGIATLARIHDGSALRAGEFLIELIPKDHRLVLVTDAWFFKEGESNRWAAAKYGEFRVDDKGQALLVGLRGEQLEKL
jgi:uncharacterized membrane-anchored protein